MNLHQVNCLPRLLKGDILLVGCEIMLHSSFKLTMRLAGMKVILSVKSAWSICIQCLMLASYPLSRRIMKDVKRTHTHIHADCQQKFIRAGRVSSSSSVFWTILWYPFVDVMKKVFWDKVFKNGPNKNCRGQPLKNLKGYGLLKQTLPLQIFQKLSFTNFTWPIPEYFVPSMTTVFSRLQLDSGIPWLLIWIFRYMKLISTLLICILSSQVFIMFL